jgi:hypothetical protein
MLIYQNFHFQHCVEASVRQESVRRGQWVTGATGWTAYLHSETFFTFFILTKHICFRITIRITDGDVLVVLDEVLVD